MITDELRAIGKISALLEALGGDDARGRVLRYINDVEMRRNLPATAVYTKAGYEPLEGEKELFVEPMRCREPEL